MKKNSVGLFELETAVLECFLEKTPLSPLGVNNKHGGKVVSMVVHSSDGNQVRNISLMHHELS
jgi:hypothetical protein